MVLPFEVKQNTEGKNKGNCKVCRITFKKDDYFILLEKARLNKMSIIKLCPICFLKPLANKIGWANVEKLLLKIVEEQL
jgi:hypothetical protein